MYQIYVSLQLKHGGTLVQISEPIGEMPLESHVVETIKACFDRKNLTIKELGPVMEGLIDQLVKHLPKDVSKLPNLVESLGYAGIIVHWDLFEINQPIILLPKNYIK